MNPEPSVAVADPAQRSAGQSNLNTLLDSAPAARLALSVQPAGETHLTVVDAAPLPPPAPVGHKTRRRGRVACLPKTARDMVGRMLTNGVPYKNISFALSELGFSVNERNLSNWATGGFLEWSFGQDLVMENRQAQDLLVDHLRRDDASELTEVGLQAAATRLSQILLRKAARAEDVEANLGPFSKMVELLSHITRDLNALQQKRDADRRALGKAHDPLRIKEMDDSEAVAMERSYSVPSDEMKLEHPKSPPLLQPRSTADVIAQFDKEAEDFKKMENKARWMEMLAAATPKPVPATPKPIAATPKPIAATLKSAAAPAKQPARPAPANATKQPATTPPAQKQNPNPPPAQPPALTKAPVSPQPKTLNQPPIR